MATPEAVTARAVEAGVAKAEDAMVRDEARPGLRAPHTSSAPDAGFPSMGDVRNGCVRISSVGG
jgi:hypothetical protein